MSRIGERAEIMRDEQEKARERMSAGGGDKKSGKEKIPDPVSGTGQSRDKVAALVGVNPRYISDAAAIRRTGGA